jgi:dCMP deaminase
MDEFEAIVQQQTEIDRRFLRDAYKYAMKHSQDPSTATGVVIVKNGVVLIKGANRACEGVVLTPEITSCAARYEYIEHAERDAIANAAKMGVPLYKSTIYSPWFPCAPCARAIINAGIIELVTHKELQDLSAKLDAKWGDSQKYAADILEQAGVKHRDISCRIGDDIVIRFKRENYTL